MPAGAGSGAATAPAAKPEGRSLGRHRPGHKTTGGGIRGWPFLFLGSGAMVGRRWEETGLGVVGKRSGLFGLFAFAGDALAVNRGVLRKVERVGRETEFPLRDGQVFAVLHNLKRQRNQARGVSNDSACP